MDVGAMVSRIWRLAAPVVAGEAMEIVDIELRREGGRRGWVLRFYLDREGGPNLDDLARVSRRLSDLLDVHDVAIEGPYTLEVSSPGVNRVLKKPEHFLRFVGKKVRVRTRETIEGRRNFLGYLKGVHEDAITVSQGGREFRIQFSLIDRANYEHDWGE